MSKIKKRSSGKIIVSCLSKKFCFLRMTVTEPKSKFHNAKSLSFPRHSFYLKNDGTAVPAAPLSPPPPTSRRATGQRWRLCSPPPDAEHLDEACSALKVPNPGAQEESNVNKNIFVC
jgi:hypothetical protein